MPVCQTKVKATVVRLRQPAEGSTFPALELAVGADGSAWVTEPTPFANGNTETLAHVTAAGSVTYVTVPAGEGAPEPVDNRTTTGPIPAGMAAGPAGSVWFAEKLAGVVRLDDLAKAGFFAFPIPYPSRRIGRVSASGKVTMVSITRYRPDVVAAGAGGSLWIAGSEAGDGRGDYIGRLAPAGQFASWELPAGHSIDAMTAVPDGSVWFIDVAHHSFGHITAAGAITERPFSWAQDKEADTNYGISLGPDGSLWVTESGRLGRITPDGKVHTARYPRYAYNVAADPDGTVWVFGSGGVERFDPRTSVTTEILLSPLFRVEHLAIGRGHTIWVTDGSGVDDGAIAHFQAPPADCRVPRLYRKTVSQARQLLKAAGCELGRVRQRKPLGGRRRIVSQSPAAGRSFAAGTRVAVDVGAR